MPWLGKRSADSPVMTPSAKVPNVSASGLGDGEWICQNCGNLNHAGRMVCNMRKCGAPKPEERWTCFCGNENYAGRLVCNLRKCGMLKPGLKLQDLAKLAGGGPQLPAEVLPPRQKQTPPGSWKCIDCGNVNFPNREVCNGRNGTCAQPRDTCDGGPPDDNEAPRAVPSSQNHSNHSLAATLAGFGKGGAPTPKAGPMAATPKASGPMNAPPGSWVCKSCMNVNFPTRTTCNSHNCGMPRDEVDGGPPGFQAAVPSSAGRGGAGGKGGAGGGAGGDAPPGSWTCDACGNINWPGRTSCNRRSCGLPRST